MTNFRRTLHNIIPMLLICAAGACGDDDDDANPGTSGSGGTAGSAGSGSGGDPGDAGEPGSGGMAGGGDILDAGGRVINLTPERFFPEGVTVDKNGNFYVGSMELGSIFKATAEDAQAESFI